MIKTTYLAEEVFILNDPPQWGRGFSGEFSVVTDSQESLTMRATRRPYSNTVRSTIKFSVFASGSALRKLNAAIRELKTQPVLLPFWPAVSHFSDVGSMPASGGLAVAFKRDWSQYELFVPGAEPVWPDPTDLVAPVLRGFIDNADLKWRNGVSYIWPVDFTESSRPSDALSFPLPALTAGPQPTGYSVAPKLMPFRPNHQDVGEDFKVKVTKENVGFSRDFAATHYPHEVFRGQTASYTIVGASRVMSLIGWFASEAGKGSPFWCPGAFTCAVASAPAISSALALHVDDDSAVQPGDYVCVTADSGGSFGAAKVASKAANVLTLSSALGVAVAAGRIISPLILSVSTNRTMKVTWLSPTMAKATIALSEVRPETLVPGTETVGTTIGRLSARVVLFDFTRDFRNGTSVHYRFTSYESDVSWGGNSWVSGPFECGDVSQSLNLEEDSCEIKSFIVKPDGTLYSDNPLVQEVALLSEVPLSVVVWFADIDQTSGTVSNAAKVFSGDCRSFSRSGNQVTATCRMGGSIYETELPRMIRGTFCNHVSGSNDGTFLISAGCTLLKTNWKFTATVANAISSAYPFELNVASLARVSGSTPTYFANWFVNGWVEIGTGSDVQRRQIVGSTNPVAGAMTLNLHRYFSSVPALGASVVIYPGCDGLFKTCKAYDATNNPLGKFNNKSNFGGEPFTPTGNPAAVNQPNLGTQGGKK